MTGADLANLVNEAALIAARRGEGAVSPRDLTDALEKVQLGTARNVVIPEDERRRTAYHEAGHALIGMVQPGADPVRKVSIIPRGRALGVTLSTPERDRYGYDANYLRGRIIGALGGMAAEQEVFGVVTSGGFCPSLKQGMGLGFVPPDLAGIGQEVVIDIRGAQVPARVVERPFYKQASHK